jgi:hypothetical protein
VTDTLEVIDLESLLSDEPGCQVNHIKIPCSVHVEARMFSCLPAFNLCGNATRYKLMRMERNGPCGYCFRPTSECWSVIPI